MKIRFAPPWWRPGVDSEFASRRSGLPIGYFDKPLWRERWLIVVICIVIVVFAIAR